MHAYLALITHLQVQPLLLIGATDVVALATSATIAPTVDHSSMTHTVDALSVRMEAILPVIVPAVWMFPVQPTPTCRNTHTRARVFCSRLATTVAVRVTSAAIAPSHASTVSASSVTNRDMWPPSVDPPIEDSALRDGTYKIRSCQP